MSESEKTSRELAVRRTLQYIESSVTTEQLAAFYESNGTVTGLVDYIAINVKLNDLDEFYKKAFSIKVGE